MKAKDMLITEKRQSILWLTINRPGQRNALNPNLMNEMGQAIEDAGHDRTIRAIVITGAGVKAFCAGADLESGDSFVLDDASPTSPFANLLRAAQASTIPLIARINGACVAGGMGLLAMCDMAIAVDDAVFGLPEVKVGVFPMQVLSVLQRIIPSRALYELCYTGELIDAQEARRLGLLNYVVPSSELDVQLSWLLSRMTDKAPLAIRRGRYAMRRIEAMGFEESISLLESQIGLLTLGHEAREGMSAFRERRKPVWDKQ
ncbi:enoyl-CoA hydratase [Pollutimonas nitritireducens]|uniref:Enoyl-CoA hydratase n=1 Tax=Pollutimonas nitritireducens TaxID=2045209 RepID=A0A2N4UAJ3_9BURK|nr:enoyl-CoA hydratase/isomerase family protein [Pollutimonas nitritireducens]PLC52029.1 enoyl-CoA hydratase [Pollutimonas nitritireducens]